MWGDHRMIPTIISLLAICWVFWCKVKITEADASTIWMYATLSRLIGAPPLLFPPFLQWLPFLLQFILALDRHQVCWLAYHGVFKLIVQTVVNKFWMWYYYHCLLIGVWIVTGNSWLNRLYALWFHWSMWSRLSFWLIWSLRVKRGQNCLIQMSKLLVINF